MKNKNLKKICPKAFEPMKIEKSKSSYTEEERYSLFTEGKIRVPSPTPNKKRYNKKKERQKKFAY